MSKLTAFSKMIGDVHLNGLITNCLIKIEDNVAKVTAMDHTEAVLVITSAPLEYEDCEIGVEDLAQFSKILKVVEGKNTTITINKDSTAMVIKPEGGAKVTYLLYDADFIQSYNEEWGDSIISDEIEESGQDSPIPLDSKSVADFIEIMNVVPHDSVYINVDKRGQIHLHGGKESDNQFDLVIGKSKEIGMFSLKVYGKNLVSVLNRVDFTQEPMLYLAQDSSIIITTKTSNWLLKPLELDIDG
jgi:hypothetical protein